MLQNQIVILWQKWEKGGHGLAFVTFPQRSTFASECYPSSHDCMANRFPKPLSGRDEIPSTETNLIEELLQAVQHPPQPLVFELDAFRFRHLDVRHDDGDSFRHQQLQVTLGFVLICFDQFFQSLDVFFRRNIVGCVAGYFA